MKSLRIYAIALLALLAGCATPPEVKQALVSLDQGYSDNITMMQQYRDLASQIHEREQTWNRYINRRIILISALKWATTDPSVDPDEPSKLLGDRLVALVNCVRLKGLSEKKKKENGEIVFVAGGQGCKAQGMPEQLKQSAGTMTGVIQALPRIVAAVNDRADERLKPQDDLVQITSLQGFDDYQTNVQALRTINSTIKRYLDIDQTVKADDLNQITDSLRKLSR